MRKTIDGDRFVKNNSKGDSYAHITSQSDEMVNEIEVKIVKITGNLKGTKEKIDLVMSPDVFSDWKNKIKESIITEDECIHIYYLLRERNKKKDFRCDYCVRLEKKLKKKLKFASGRKTE